MPMIIWSFATSLNAKDGEEMGGRGHYGSFMLLASAFPSTK